MGLMSMVVIGLTVAQVTRWLAESSALASYVLVAVLLLSSGFGVPIPEDIPLLVGGWLCRRQQANLWIMMPVAWAFVLAGDCVLYALGRRYGHHVPKLPGLRLVLTEKRICRASQFVERHGAKTLFLMRFVTAVRAAVWFAAGALKIPFWKFIAYDGSAALLFALGYLLLGWWFGDQWQHIRHYTRTLQIGLLMVVVGLVLWQLIRYRQRRASDPGKSTGDLSA